MNLVFMGTPDFAVPSLKKLVESGYTISLVITQEDKPVGRKQILTPPAVKQAAMELNIPVFQPKTLRDLDAQERIRKENPDCIIVAAYGKILPKEVLEIPNCGCVNIHGSLLPKYRGAAPIQRAVIDGESETGVSIMKMDEGLDTGDVYAVSKRSIPQDITSGELFDLLAQDGADLLVNVLPQILDGSIKATKQEGESNYAAMLSKDESRLDFHWNALKVHNHIRGLNPWPIAFMYWSGKKTKVFSSSVGPYTDKEPGTIICGTPLRIACGEGTSIEIKEVQLEGGKRLSTEDFWRGHSLPIGTVLETD